MNRPLPEPLNEPPSKGKSGPTNVKKPKPPHKKKIVPNEPTKQVTTRQSSKKHNAEINNVDKDNDQSDSDSDFVEEKYVQTTIDESDKKHFFQIYANASKDKLKPSSKTVIESIGKKTVILAENVKTTLALSDEMVLYEQDIQMKNHKHQNSPYQSYQSLRTSIALKTEFQKFDTSRGHLRPAEFNNLGAYKQFRLTTPPITHRMSVKTRLGGFALSNLIGSGDQNVCIH